MDLIREVRRATLAALKADVALTALIPAANIAPIIEPAPWPFIRWDAPSSTPLFWGATVEFRLHVFGKAVYSGGAMVETAEDFVSRATSAAHNIVYRNRKPIPGGDVRFRARLTQVIQDGDEADAYHGIINVAARALAE